MVRAGSQPGNTDASRNGGGAGKASARSPRRPASAHLDFGLLCTPGPGAARDTLGCLKALGLVLGYAGVRWTLPRSAAPGLPTAVPSVSLV